MYQYPGQMGMAQPMQGQPGTMYNPMTPAMPGSPYGGPQSSQAVPQVPGQGNYTPNTQIGMRVRPVASYDEAKAVPTDFMGNMLILTDMSHGCIYTKVLDPATGSSIFRTYALVPEQAPQPAQSVPTAPAPATQVYDAKSEIERLRGELEGLKRELGIVKEETHE